MKRLFDLLLAVFLLVTFSPLLVTVALAVKASSPGPAVYWARRVGRDSRLFAMPKFRTMRVDTPQLATHLLQNPDRWITPVGRWLRRTSLDELPQLWSIALGQMSFVGPRPALYNQADLIHLRKEAGIDRLAPGLTGWAQVNGRDELSIEEKVARDAEYLEKQSLLFDLWVIALTANRCLRGDGVAEGARPTEGEHNVAA